MQITVLPCIPFLQQKINHHWSPHSV
uniref:Uncharacterized protein n=1 Tax=Arundo donax TaxID=35708 RepID=A0A0A9HQQ3_ARUDO